MTRLTEYVELEPAAVDGRWISQKVKAIIAPGCCSEIILGMPFLSHNQIVIDHEYRTCIAKKEKVDLLNPVIPEKIESYRIKNKVELKKGLRRMRNEANIARKPMMLELKALCALRKCQQEFEDVKDFEVVAAVRVRVESLAIEIEYAERESKVKESFPDLFKPIPHVSRLPDNVTASIKLKDANQVIASRTYSCPRKFKEAWHTLIQNHLAAGRIRPSSSALHRPHLLFQRRIRRPCPVG